MFTEEQQGIKDFIDEVSGDILNAEELLVNIQENQNYMDSITVIFRTFHNIKGVSGMFDWGDLQEVFHIAESLLVFYRDRKLRPNEDAVEIILKVFDYFKNSSQYFLEHKKFDSKKPYETLFLLSKLLGELEDSKDSLNGTGTQSSGDSKNKNAKDDSIRISKDQVEELMEIVSDYIQLQNKMIAILGNSSDSLAIRSDIQRFSTQLQGFALSIRLSPLNPILNNLNRVVSGAARDLGKKIKLKISGGETQLDRRVIELLREPLMHMVRNSVDHGLETPDERVAANKSDTGLITIDAYQQSGQVAIVLSDDGKGIHPDRVLKKAIEKGLIDEVRASALSSNEIINFIFHPGFSTAEAVTNLSGRGVGMDAVKSAVESVGGNVEVESEVGNGSRFKLTLPLSLAIVKSLTFKVGEQNYAVPQISVEEVVTKEFLLSSGELSTLEDGSYVLKRRKIVIPVVDLNKVFKAESEGDVVFIINRYRGNRFAIKVNEILGTRDFVSQPSPSIFSNIDIISGVNQLNSGEYIGLVDLGVIEQMIDATALSANLSTTASLNDSNQTVSEIFRSQQKMVFFNSGRPFSLAVQNIKEVFQIEANQLEYIKEKCFITTKDKTYPVLKLFSLFANTERLQHRDLYTVLLVNRDNHSAAIVCDEFYGIHRLPNEFEDMIRDHGILGTTNFENKTYLVPNIRQIFEIEFPEKFTSHVSNHGSFNVMIVEDDKFFAATLGDFLAAHGFSHIHCENGNEAKKVLESIYIDNQPVHFKNREIDRIDYIVTDYEMPVMNGLELLRWIRKHNNLSSIPISMCTAVGDSSTRNEATKLGIEFFAGKMKYEIFIHDIINKKRQQDLGIENTDKMLHQVES